MREHKAVTPGQEAKEQSPLEHRRKHQREEPAEHLTFSVGAPMVQAGTKDQLERGHLATPEIQPRVPAWPARRPAPAAGKEDSTSTRVEDGLTQTPQRCRNVSGMMTTQLERNTRP